MSSPRRDETNRQLVSSLQVGKAQDRVAQSGSRSASREARTCQESRSITAEQLALALGATLRPGARQYRANCPVHQNDGKKHTGAFIIKTGRTGGVVFRCMSGCAQENVIETLTSLGLWGSPKQAQAVNSYSKLDATIATIWAIGLRAELTEQMDEVHGQIMDALDANDEPSEAIGERYFRLTQILERLDQAGADFQKVTLYRTAQIKNPAQTRHALLRGSVRCRDFLGGFSAAWDEGLSATA